MRPRLTPSPRPSGIPCSFRLRIATAIPASFTAIHVPPPSGSLGCIARRLPATTAAIGVPRARVRCSSRLNTSRNVARETVGAFGAVSVVGMIESVHIAHSTCLCVTRVVCKRCGRATRFRVWLHAHVRGLRRHQCGVMHGVMEDVKHFARDRRSESRLWCLRRGHGKHRDRR